MSRLCFLGTVCLALLLSSVPSWGGVTLSNGSTLKLQASRKGQKSQLDVLYIPTSYYESLIKSERIEQPFTISLAALFDKNYDRDTYSFLDHGGSDITKAVFQANGDYSQHGIIVGKVPINNDNFEFYVRPSIEQKEDVALQVNLPLISNYVYSKDVNGGRGTDLAFYIHIRNNDPGGRQGATKEFLIRPANPVLEDELQDSGSDLRLKLTFSADVKYELTSSSSDKVYNEPTTVEKWLLDFKEPLPRGRGIEERQYTHLAVSILPKMDNSFASTHLEKDKFYLGWKAERITSLEEVEDMLRADKASSQVIPPIPEPEEPEKQQEEQGEEPQEDQGEEQAATEMIDWPNRFYKKRLFGYLLVTNTNEYLFIKVKRGNSLDVIANKVARVYDKTKKDVMHLIIRSNHNKDLNPKFVEQVPLKTRQSRTTISLDGNLYDCSSIMPGLKIFLRMSDIRALP